MIYIIFRSIHVGINTGVCNTTAGYCMLYAWASSDKCPQENKNSTQNILVGAGNFSIFIRVTVKFPKFGVTR